MNALGHRARWPLAVLLLVAAAVHVPVIPEHLYEARYMGVLFVIFTFAVLALAAVLVLTDPPVLYWLAGGLCAAAIGVYVATRLTAFPELAGDVGNWSDVYGTTAIIVEASAALVAATTLRRLSR